MSETNVSGISKTSLIALAMYALLDNILIGKELNVSLRAAILPLLAFLALLGLRYGIVFLALLGFFGAISEAAFGLLVLLYAGSTTIPALHISRGLASLLLGSFTAYFVLREISRLEEIKKKSEEIILGPPKSEYAVEVADVYKDYYVGDIVVHALRGISFKVKRGEFVAIMGPSGSGKSTLLNLIGALDKPTKGKVYIDGIDITKLDDKQLSILRNKKIGFIFQTFNLINRTKVLRNIELPAIVAGVPKKERVRRALELLKVVNLPLGVANRRPIQLSGGQQQRVAIARALMNNPSIILADEPTGSLDSKTGREIMNYLRMLNEKFGTTIIVVTHDRSVAEMADRILHIRDGKIVREEVLRKR